MTALEAYRDDGPLAAAIAQRGIAPEVSARLGWFVPALIRALEYGGIIAVVRFMDPQEMPLTFALLGVLAFHHYDIVYRQRHRGEFVPRWVTLAGGGWEVRVLVVAALAVLGILHVGLILLSIGLGMLFVGESVSSWMRATEIGATLEGDE